MKALELAKNALLLQTQYTMQPNIGRMDAARQAKDDMNSELRRLAEVNAELLDALQLATSLAMVKFGNLDKDANLIFAQNLELIAKAKAQQ